jgi:LacI family transcriptional regulator
LVKLKDVADMAGVSVSTVSNVLNGYTKSGIKQETVHRVTKIANEMGYRPNAIARSLRFQKADSIGFYTGYNFSDPRNRFMSEIYAGMKRGCDQFKFDMLLPCSTQGKAASEIYSKLSNGKIDGLIVHATPEDPLVSLLANGRLPAVAVADRQALIPSVVGDDAQGMEMLVNYLWERGHRNIAFLTTQRPLTAVEARSTKFQQILTDLGGKSLVFPIPWADMDEFLKSFVAEPNHPTALCVYNDDGAYRALKSCLENGIRVPDDLAIVGFDGLLEKRLPARNLVTTAVPWEQIGYEAVSLLIQQMEGHKVQPLTTFPVELIAGDTA